VPAAVLSLACALGIGTTIQQTKGLFFWSIWFAFCGTVGSVVVAINVIPAFRDLFQGRMVRSSGLMLLLPLPLFVGMLGFPVILLARMADSAYAVSLLAVVMLNVVFVFLLQTPTKLGRERMDQVEGFRQFLSAADLDRVDARTFPTGPLRCISTTLPTRLHST